jgi:hypothetical protein
MEAMEIWFAILQCWPAPGPPCNDVLAHHFEERPGAFKRVGRTAHHDDEPRFLRADIAAGHRCIEGGESARRRRVRDPPGEERT